MTSMKSLEPAARFDDACLDEDSTALAHRLMAEHERGLHDDEPHPACPLCEFERRKRRARCRLSRVQSAVADVVEEMERGLAHGWVNDPLWDAKEDLEESAGLRATPRYVDPMIEILRRDRLLEVQHAFNILALICESEEPSASDTFWDAMLSLRRELTRGPEPIH